MAYQFAGFFACPDLPRPRSLPPDAVWRAISVPYLGVGIRIPKLLGRTPSPDELDALAQQLGLDAAKRWLYITYDCFGGDIDFVYGLGIRDSARFGRYEEDAIDRAEDVFVELMSKFGVEAEDAMRFAPFERGYWGED